ncbi:MAG: PAS domain S-box protein [Candidatus Thiodiazotropha sp. (ex Monitilora ramsayi)]|nr:PAS domain S-box protein [Candidatus Thiodiazotropha sp. (ex Monitilora ramsayi)]
MNMGQPILSDILNRDILTVSHDRPLSAVLRLMKECRTNSVLVNTGDASIGIFTLRDAVVCASSRKCAAAEPIAIHMSSPLLYSSDSMSLDESYRFMTDHGIRHLLMNSDEDVVEGIASERDLLIHLNTEDERLSDRVESVMKPNVIGAQFDETLSQALDKMTKRGLSYLLVGLQDKPIGILTEWDVARLIETGVDSNSTAVGDTVGPPLHAIRKNEPIRQARELMLSNDANDLMVTDENGEWVGVISQTDCLGVICKGNSDAYQYRDDNFHRLYGAAPLPYQSLDKDGRLLEVNNAWTDALGYLREEAIGRYIGDFHMPGQSYKLSKTLKEFAKRGSVAGAEFNYRCKDGSRKIMVIHGHIEHDWQGCFVRTHCILNEITKQREAERDLKKSEIRYRTLVEQIPALVYSAQIDEFSTTHYMSPQASEIIGYQQSDLEANPRIWDQALHPDDRNRVLEAVKNCHRNESKLSIDYRMITKDGRTIWVWDQATTVASNEGRYFQGVMLDITAQKKAEGALRASEIRFRSIFDHAAAGMIMGTSDCRIAEANKAFSEMLGYRSDEVVGMSFKDVTHPDDWEANRLQLEAVRRGDISTYHIEKRYIKKNGEPVWCLLSATWLKDERGSPAHVIALVQNIDEQKRAEAQLHNRLKEWSTLINTAPIGIGLAINRVIQWVSPKLLEMLGYTEKEVLGRNTRFAYLNDEEYERVGREKYSQIEKYHSGEVETQLKRKDGKIIDVLLRSTVLDPNDLNAGIIFTAVDISERKETEDALRLYRTLSDKAKDALFLVNVATASFFDFNQEACRSLGYERDELLQLQVPDVTDFFEKNGIDWSDLLAMFSSNGDLTIEAMHRRKNGTKFPVEINATHLTHHEHDYIVGVARDITERKQAERALQRKTTELEVLLNSIPSPVYLKDKHSQYQAVNKAFIDFMGVDEKKILGKSDLEIFPEEVAKCCLESDRTVFIDRKVVHNIEEEVLNHEGEMHWFSTTKKPLFDADGNVEGLVGISFDITENKLAVDRRIAEEKTMRETLVLEIHHRIKNHLQGVIGLLRNFSGTHGHTKEGLDTAITQLRTIATVYGLQSRRNDQQIQIKELVQACIDVHRHTLPNHVEYKINQSSSMQIHREESVPVALIINELITNALKHSAVDVNEKLVFVSFDCDDSLAKLQIRNPSKGLPEDFDFNTGHGTGTGLEILKALLPQKGAVFKLFEDAGYVVAELDLRTPVLWARTGKISGEQVLSSSIGKRYN